MLAHYTENWWAFLLRGIVAILFGIVLVVYPPALTAATLVIVLGAFAFVDGVFAIVGSVMNRKAYANWWIILLQGIIGVLFGVVAFFNPFGTALAILWVIAAWAIVIGILGIWAGITLRNEIQGEFWLILFSVLLILFGILTLFEPGIVGTFLLYIWGFSAIFGGISGVMLSLKLRGMKGQTTGGKPAMA